MILIGGQPLNLLKKLPAGAGEKIELLSLPKVDTRGFSKTFSRMGLTNPYRGATIPAGTYPFQKKAVVTMSTPCLVFASSHVSTDKIRALVGGTVEGAGKFSHPKWKGYQAKTILQFLGRSHSPISAHPGVGAYFRGKQLAHIRRDFQALSLAVQKYQLEFGKLPKKMADLVTKPKDKKEWTGPYLEGGKIPTDPWGRQYALVHDKTGSYEILCWGADGKEGGDGADQDFSTREGSLWLDGDGQEGDPADPKPVKESE